MFHAAWKPDSTFFVLFFRIELVKFHVRDLNFSVVMQNRILTEKCQCLTLGTWKKIEKIDSSLMTIIVIIPSGRIVNKLCLTFCSKLSHGPD